MDHSFFTQDFDTFARGLNRTDLALYAGIGIILYVLFKDKLNPVQLFVKNLIDKFSALINTKKETIPVIKSPVSVTTTTREDVFFKLVASWKQTRDLAVLSGCEQAVKVADQMFPFLSPNVCSKTESKEVV